MGNEKPQRPETQGKASVQWQVPLIGFSAEEGEFYRRVIVKSEDGDADTRAEARKEMEKPQNARLLLKYGDVAARLGRWLCVRTFNKYDGLAVAMYRKMQAIARDLAGPHPSPVEVQLAELAAIAWADYQRCAMNRETLKDCTFRKASYYDQRADRAHKRLVRSLRALAAVRKVDLTAVQININGMAGLIGDQAPAAGQSVERAVEAIRGQP